MLKNIVIIVFGILFLASCDIIEGDGDIVKLDRGIFNNYSKVIISNSFDVSATSVSSANNQKITVETDNNLQEYINVYEENGILYLGSKKGKNLKPTKAIIEIYTPQDVEIVNSGSGNTTVSDSEFGNVKIENSGSGNFLINGNFHSLDLNNSGSGNITLEGDVALGIELYNSGSGDIYLLSSLDEIQISNSGSGGIDASSTHSKQVTVNNSGSGTCKVEAIEELYVIISGSGNVYYKGSPHVTKDLTGSGELKKLK